MTNDILSSQAQSISIVLRWDPRVNESDAIRVQWTNERAVRTGFPLFHDSEKPYRHFLGERVPVKRRRQLFLVVHLLLPFCQCLTGIAALSDHSWFTDLESRRVVVMGIVRSELVLIIILVFHKVVVEHRDMWAMDKVRASPCVCDPMSLLLCHMVRCC